MTLLRSLLALAYPFVIFAGLQLGSARAVAIAVAALFALRFALGRRPALSELRPLLGPALIVTPAIALAALQDDRLYLLFLPVLVNVSLLAAFAATLWRGPPLVERLARLQVPDLPADEVRYCRHVTALWCVFFAGNAGVCLWLALGDDLVRWTLYTGLLAYLLMGILYGAEFVVRSWRFGRYAGTPVEPLFRRLFPHPRTAARE